MRATVLEGKAEAYTAWEAEHRAERELAERARAELARRNTAERQRMAVPPEPEVHEPEVHEPERNNMRARVLTNALQAASTYSALGSVA